jgi:hypothetical protein
MCKSTVPNNFCRHQQHFYRRPTMIFKNEIFFETMVLKLVFLYFLLYLINTGNCVQCHVSSMLYFFDLCK